MNNIEPFSSTQLPEALTVLSFGAGQDSTYILYKIIFDQEFKERYAKGHFIVIMSDTGNEHPHTYKHVEFIKGLCQEHQIPFFFLTNGEYHPKTWPTLEAQMQLNSSIMSMMFPRSCTDNLKIKPIYNFLDHYIASNYYGYNLKEKPKGKKFISSFAASQGKINVLIGIASDENHRIGKQDQTILKTFQLNLFSKLKRASARWFERSINRVYPLVTEGVTRSVIHKWINQETSLPLPYPSNCMFCPYLSKIEMLWLYRFYPLEWQKWVAYEKAKIEKCKDKPRNLGVKGEVLLEEMLQDALSEFGYMSNQELDDYKMSHGHCVMSRY